VRILKVLLVVVVGLVAVGAYGLFTSREVPEKSRFALDLNAMREAAGPIDACPTSARAELVAGADLPGPVVMAGGPFSMLRFGFYSWQLRYDDGTAVLLDPVHSRRTQDQQAKGQPYDDAAWDRQEKAIAAASVIAVTHEHYDHLGGAADSAHFASFGPKLKLTAAQRRKPSMAGVTRDLAGEPTLESGPEGSLHKVAPGVVAVTAPGHTPGSQMFFVRMKGGAELLLVGDIVWQEANLETLTTRARFVSWLGEDAEAITHQMRAIVDFKKANPSADVVVAHDVPAMERRFASGAVGRGFND
jgi:glyoxylase-like metal-dependent hydrolase (beta-lactamase superfamily II)